jgi:AraC family transcriptional regulator
MKLFIKNMVCNRCIMVVREQCEKVGIKPTHVEMGEVELPKPLTEVKSKDLALKLSELGFEILDDKRHKQIETIKTRLIEKVQSGEIEEHFSISDFLSKKLSKEYSLISRLFSEVEGITIEHFFIHQKIEKVKEWLTYNELSLGEITWKLGYSSVAHLSAQFKKVTGMTPTEFKKLGASHRKSLDQV